MGIFLKEVWGTLITLLFLVSLAMGCQSNWGDEELFEEIKGLRPDQITSASLDQSDPQPIELPKDILESFVSRLRYLEAAKSVGEVSGWAYYCKFEIQAKEQGPFLVAVATRHSLAGRPIVILRDKRSNNPRIGFYEGEALHTWLKSENLCANKVPAPKE
ncbi:MAG: hypothetical protein WBG93_16285 [Thermoanaerobaculia bacterium]